jgi:hypothetical protein
MLRYSNGRTMSQPSIPTCGTGTPNSDSEFWSAKWAQQRFAEGYELIAFDLPAANGCLATIGWALFSGLGAVTLAASSQRTPARRRGFKCWRPSDIRQRLKLACSRQRSRAAMVHKGPNREPPRDRPIGCQ